jgi:hypothetical protein
MIHGTLAPVVGGVGRGGEHQLAPSLVARKCLYIQGYVEHAQDTLLRNGVSHASCGCIILLYKSMYQVQKLY